MVYFHLGTNLETSWAPRMCPWEPTVLEVEGREQETRNPRGARHSKRFNPNPDVDCVGNRRHLTDPSGGTLRKIMSANKMCLGVAANNSASTTSALDSDNQQPKQVLDYPYTTNDRSVRESCEERRERYKFSCRVADFRVGGTISL